MSRLTSFPPPLLREWPVPVRVVFAGLLPAAFGFLCGALLGSSGTVFLLLQIIGVLGGFAAGFEHDHWRGGVLRFRVARTFGYGASAQLTRGLLGRLDGAGISGRLRIVSSLDAVLPVSTQGPTF